MVSGLVSRLYSGSEAGSHLRLIDSCITQLMAHGPSRPCNESKDEEVEGWACLPGHERVSGFGFRVMGLG